VFPPHPTQTRYNTAKREENIDSSGVVPGFAVAPTRQNGTIWSLLITRMSRLPSWWPLLKKKKRHNFAAWIKLLPGVSKTLTVLLITFFCEYLLNPFNAELNPIRHLLALAGAHHFVDVTRIRVKVVCLALKMKTLSSCKTQGTTYQSTRRNTQKTSIFEKYFTINITRRN
jgi:hypothetical protein